MPNIQILPAPPGGEGGSYTAVVDGTPVPVSGYVAENASDGRVMVSLIIAADQLSIGIPPSRPSQQPPHQNQPPVSTWGNPAVPDPRSNVPGWVPPPAAADAGRERGGGAHRLVGETIRVIRSWFQAGRLA